MGIQSRVGGTVTTSNGKVGNSTTVKLPITLKATKSLENHLEREAGILLRLPLAVRIKALAEIADALLEPGIR